MSWQEMKKDDELVGSMDEAQERTLIQRGRANTSHEDNMLSFLSLVVSSHKAFSFPSQTPSSCLWDLPVYCPHILAPTLIGFIAHSPLSSSGHP